MTLNFMLHWELHSNYICKGFVFQYNPIFTLHHLYMARQIFTYRIKNGANKVMGSILRFGGQFDSRIEGKACRITVTSYTITDNIKKQYWEEYKNDLLYQVKVIDIEEQEFLVLQSLLEPLDEVIVVES